MRTSLLSDPIRRPARRFVRLSLCAALLSLPVLAPASPLSRPALAQAAPVVGVVDVTVRCGEIASTLPNAFTYLPTRRRSVR